MPKLMLIDAAHPKAVRVIITNNGKIEEFEYENNLKKSIKGNIYLAKVTRVEHSLQAVFVDYGGNRNGFLPFSEIHPDYYQIPISDREKLLEDIRKEQIQRAELREKGKHHNKAKASSENVEATSSPEEESEQITTFNSAPSMYVEHDEDFEKPQFYKRYKIQEVIKKDQVILVKVVKEERGNKGAALTSYISLAGRYCVLMPNATKGGGVSKKIEDDQDRERLKSVAKELTNDLEGQGAIIIRTAGAYKTKTEIKRDFTYLQNLWNNIRNNTVKSNAPTFIHEEGDVIKKAIRDLYDSEIDQILIEGEQAFNEAQKFMKLILPKHVNKICLYQSTTPLFVKHGIEQQIASFYSNQVSLKSGGYLVINQTEALVAIDVNSGRATSERNVESTAVKTNIEAAHEIARQIRMRDLSGLIVIDFIDMMESKNKRLVEKALKEALSYDKAKIQMGRISPFGLLEMSRQRLRQSFIESNTDICEHCQGRGRIRDLEATATVVLRAIENELDTLNKNEEVHVSGASKLMFYLLNKKRLELAKLESKYPEKVIFYTDETAGGDGFFIESKRNSSDIKDPQALSGIDQALGENAALVEDAQPSFKHKMGKKKFKKPYVPNTQNNAINFEEKPLKNPPSSFRDKPFEPKQNKDFEKGRKFKRSNNHNHNNNATNNSNNTNADSLKKEMDGRMAEEVSVENFDKEMAARRKDNQSLLKEIWKKIVD